MAHDEHAPKPEAGFLRLKQIIGPAGPIPVSKTTWWDGCRHGRFPAPIKMTPGITVWRKSDIDALVAALSTEALGQGSSRREPLRRRRR
jgi:predicted DNA-binding transcriptional regulator AlpA